MIRPVSVENSVKYTPAFKGVTFLRDAETRDLSVAVWYDETNNDQVEWRDELNRSGMCSRFDLGHSLIAGEIGDIVNLNGSSVSQKENAAEIKKLLKELTDSHIKPSLDKVVKVFLGEKYTAGRVIGNSLLDIDDVIENGKAKYFPAKDETQEYLQISK